jgi:pilus assembly protein CpaB
MVLGLALVCGLMAMLAVNQLFSKPGTPQSEMVDVLVAARELKLEEVLNKPDMVKVAKMPKESVPAGSFRAYEDVAERWVQIKMLPDEPILDPKLAPRDTPRGLLPRIPVGMRAFSIEVSEQSGVSGFIMPDHRVDVIQAKTSTRRGTAGLPEAETVLQDVLVLASGTNLTRTEDKAITVRTVTLALTPDQVDTLVAAKSQGGALSLSMRAINDHEIVEKPVQEPEPPPVEMVDVVVAARDLSPDEVIVKELTRIESRPKDKVLPGAFHSLDDLADRWVRTHIDAGDPIIEARLAPVDLVSRIAPGKRAVAIEVNEQTGVAGFVLPGHRVDIVKQVAADRNDAKASKTSSAETVLQDVLVLAAGQVFNRTEDKTVLSRTVTIEVTPDQVAQVLAARADGPLSLSLRGRDDHEMVGKAPDPGPALASLPPRVRGRVTIFHGPRGYERHTLFEQEAPGWLGPDADDPALRQPGGE